MCTPLFYYRKEKLFIAIIMVNNRTCIVCGTKYHYCPNCENANQPSWLTAYHSETCKEIFSVLNKHYFNHLTDQEAIDKLNELDLSVLDYPGADEHIKQKIKQLMSKSKKTRARKTKQENDSEKV